MRIGIVSDTHGELPQGVLDALQGAEKIIHAGDVGGQWILDELAEIAPVVAVRGNMDSGDLGWRLPERLLVPAGDDRILVQHTIERVRAGGIPSDARIVVIGHTHRPRIEWQGDVLYVNPGSAGGHNRDGSGPTVALLELAAGGAQASIIAI